MPTAWGARAAHVHPGSAWTLRAALSTLDCGGDATQAEGGPPPALPLACRQWQPEFEIHWQTSSSVRGHGTATATGAAADSSRRGSGSAAVRARAPAAARVQLRGRPRRKRHGRSRRRCSCGRRHWQQRVADPAVTRRSAPGAGEQARAAMRSALLPEPGVSSFKKTWPRVPASQEPRVRSRQRDATKTPPRGASSARRPAVVPPPCSARARDNVSGTGSGGHRGGGGRRLIY